MQYVVSWLSWSRVWLQTMLTLCIIIGFCWARHWCQDESLAETLESSYQKYIHEIHMDSPNVKKMWREAYKMSVWDAYSRILYIYIHITCLYCYKDEYEMFRDLTYWSESLWIWWVHPFHTNFSLDSGSKFWISSVPSLIISIRSTLWCQESNVQWHICCSFKSLQLQIFGSSRVL